MTFLFLFGCLQCVDKHGRSFLALVRVRYGIMGGKDHAVVLSILPLPKSRHLTLLRAMEGPVNDDHRMNSKRASSQAPSSPTRRGDTSLSRLPPKPTRPDSKPVPTRWPLNR